MFADFKFISLWWATFFVLGAIALPLTTVIFKKFWDKGYIFAKIIGSVLLTYTVFVLGVFKMVPFTPFSLFILIALFIAADILYLRSGKNLKGFNQVVKKYWRYFLFEEILFLVILTAWSYVRGFSPAIEGLEKFMDWGFVNSALRSRYMPPVDMWFSPQPINYYYFGHLVIAVITKLSNISSAVTYNLAIASTCALTFVSGFSLASNIIAAAAKTPFRNIVIGGIFSALILTFGGNLHPLYKILKTDIQNNGHLVLTKSALTKAADSYWYPDATRFIGFDPETNDKTIHEFPVYSFVVADLHGHMNDIGNVILFMAVLFSFSLAPLTTKKLNWPLIIASGFLLSVAFMTNAWDFAVYGLVFAIFSFIHTSYFINLKSAFVHTITQGILIIVSWYLFTIPFSLNFIPMAEGLRLSDAHSPFYQLFILYGGFWLICLPFFIYCLYSLVKKSKLSTADLFVLSLMVTATILVIIPEIGYIKDIYIYEHRRANTMFKLVYQAFIIYSLLSGYILIRFRQNLAYKILFLLIFTVHLVYPFFAVKSYYGLTQYQGLWGLTFMKDNYPDNLAAVDWINKNIPGQPVMLEAAGDSYTTFNQISIATGLPTVEGWIVHEWLWRGGYDAPAARQADVKNIYEGTDPGSVRDLLQKYSVKYIFVGDKEREQYPALSEKTFAELGAKVVFQQNNTRVYEL